MSRSIEPPPLPKYPFRNSKRRVYSGSSSRFMDPDVMEIPPQVFQPSKLIKLKEASLHDVIDIDNDEDSADLVLIGENVGKRNKGKTIETISEVHCDHQAMEVPDFIYDPPGMEFGPASGVESSNNYDPVSHNLINVDGHGSDLSYDDDDCIDLFPEEYLDIDHYEFLDNVEIPPGIEASIPLPDFDMNKSGSSSFFPWCPTQPDVKNSHKTEPSLPAWSLGPTHIKTQGATLGSSSLQAKMESDHSSGMVPASPQLFIHGMPAKKKSAVSQHGGSGLNKPAKVEFSTSQWFFGPSKMPGDSTSPGSLHNLEAMKPHTGSGMVHWKQPKSGNKAAGKSGLHSFYTPAESSFHSPGMEPASGWKQSFSYKPSFPNNIAYSSFHGPFDTLHAQPGPVFGNSWVQTSPGDGIDESCTDGPVVPISDESREEIMRKFLHFKQFDTVEDISDHHYIRNNSSSKQNSKNWAKRIQEEWKILEKDLPDSIFVRICESRMDLLRAVIIGAEGTPYHDGLFFFDVFFPGGYPNVPPQVYYHSGGLRLNPNLYNCGKVCLSLLNTWSGGKNEKWIPGVSTILQVLVSIQGLILNTKPYFNEPGYERWSGSAAGEMKSLHYNENTFLLSLRTMMYMMRRPPKNFEDFVAGHFCSRANDILVACKAYMDGAQVGCLVKGGVQDVDEGDRSCSKQFKDSLAGVMNRLVSEFSRIGAKDCEKFLPPATTGNNTMCVVPVAAT